jgi:hypothetical protein
MKNLMIWMGILMVALLLSGCAKSPLGSAQAGGAVYQYKKIDKTGASCEISITSAREVGEGTVKIGDDCAMSTEVSELGGSDEAYRVIESLVNKLPGAGLLTPPPGK